MIEGVNVVIIYFFNLLKLTLLCNHVFN